MDFGVIGALVIIGFIFWCWNKADTAECHLCGKKIKISNKGTHKYWGKTGYYGSLMTHVLCETCGTKNDQDADKAKKARQAAYRKANGM